MILRLDRLMTDLPKAKNPSPNAAAAVQELLGGKFGEMSTLMNYTYQSFNFRGRAEQRPFYDLIANIAAEEFAHIELVAYAINLLLTGATPRGDDPTETPLEVVKDARNSYHYLATGQQAYCGDSQGNFWTGQHVYSSGNLKLDLLHNFFLECGARANKIRVYEMAKEPTARALTGFLLVRGGVHIVAYAKALEKLSGVAVGKLLPIPDISNKRFPESKRHEDAGLHRILYRFSPDDYRRVGEVWNGEHPEDGQPLEVVDGPPEGAAPPDLEAEPQLTSPVGPDPSDLDPQMLEEYARRIFGPDIKDDVKRRKDAAGGKPSAARPRAKAKSK
jgi:Mn-containing catalase